METASLSRRMRNLYCRLCYDDSWASQVRFISPIFLLFPIGIQFLQRKSDTIKQSFKKSFPLRPVLLVVIIHDFLFLSVIPVKYLGFTQLWFYTTLKQIISYPRFKIVSLNYDFTLLSNVLGIRSDINKVSLNYDFTLLSNIHYHSRAFISVSLNYDFTLLSNKVPAVPGSTSVSLNYDFTLLSNFRQSCSVLQEVSLNYDFTLLSNNPPSRLNARFVSLNYDFTLLSNQT